jgi:hypothetical protein
LNGKVWGEQRIAEALMVRHLVARCQLGTGIDFQASSYQGNREK